MNAQPKSRGMKRQMRRVTEHGREQAAEVGLPGFAVRLLGLRKARALQQTELLQHRHD